MHDSTCKEWLVAHGMRGGMHIAAGRPSMGGEGACLHLAVLVGAQLGQRVWVVQGLGMGAALLPRLLWG